MLGDRPVEVSLAVDVRVLLGQQRREVPDRVDFDVDRAQRPASGGPELGVPLGRHAQPRPGDLRERDCARRPRPVQPQPADPPQITIELALRVGALGQVLQMLVGVTQLADGARPGPRAAGGVASATQPSTGRLSSDTACKVPSSATSWWIITGISRTRRSSWRC